MKLSQAEIQKEISDFIHKPIPFAARPYPFDELGDREFEIFVYSLFRKEIDGGKYVTRFDDISLMVGVGERGRDCVLHYQGKNVGLIQCKNYKIRLTKPNVAQEIIKFALHYLRDNELISDIKNFTYYLVVSTDFSESAVELLSNFNQRMVNETELENWTKRVIQKNKRFQKLKFDEIETSLRTIFTHLHVKKLNSADLNMKLQSHKELIEQFFAVKTVIDIDTFENVFSQQIGELNRPNDVKLDQVFWLHYLRNVNQNFNNWHIPEELEDIISWHVDPVPVDTFIRLKPQVKPSLFPEEKVESKDNKSKVQASLSLNEIIEQSRKLPILIRGSSGAGKSTCLKYLLFSISEQTLRLVGPQNSGDQFIIPVMVSLRRYGRLDLRTLVFSQLQQNSMEALKEEKDNFFREFEFCLLLDGIDEVKPEWREDLIDEIVVWSQLFPNHRIIATTRTQPELSTIEKFDCFDIQPLSTTAIRELAICYLGSQTNNFLQLVFQRNLQDVAQTPLLLSFCLIIFRRRAATFDSLAEIFNQIVRLYKQKWEEPIKSKRHKNPFEWIVLERALSFLSFKMLQEKSFSFSYEYSLTVLAELAHQLEVSHLWSKEKHNLQELVNQLLSHNFLVSANDELHFWHASFRDYFAALYLIEKSKPIEEILQIVEQKEWGLVTAFLGTLLPENQKVRATLVEIALQEESIWPVDVLGLMGNQTTSDLLMILAKTVYSDSFYYAVNIIDSRKFEGKPIVDDLLRIISAIDSFYDYGYEVDSLNYTFPDPEWIDFDFFNAAFGSALFDLASGDVENAKTNLRKIESYLDNLVQLKKRELTDPWLIERKLENLSDFQLFIRKQNYVRDTLIDFCRNTLRQSSIPYLEIILSNIEDPKIRLEASLAIHCLKHQRSS